MWNIIAVTSPCGVSELTLLVQSVFFFNEKLHIVMDISVKFIPMGLIGNKSTLVQVMAWRWLGDKPLPEPMMTKILVAIWHH